MSSDPDDELDALLRTTMKTLDEQVPSGYFEALPGRTLERLAAEEGHMQTGSTSSGSEAKSQAAAPAAPQEGDENSGLHDIRSLAQTTKERISSKRITLSPTKTVSEEELIASASGSWKSLALPQPASMVSLPAISELPSASVVEAKPAAKPMIGASIAAASAPAKSSRKLMAIAGLGIAVAAGVTLFVTMGGKSNQAASTQAKPEVVATATPTTTASLTTPTPPPAPVAPTVQHIDDTAPAGNAAAAGSATEVVAAAPAPTQAPTTAPPPASPKVIASKSRAKAPSPPPAAKPVAIAKTDTPPAPETKGGKSGEKGDATNKAVSNGQESLDQLIKEAGAEDKPKATPTLDKKELSANDFKAGMSAIQGKAQACFKGTQGMAAVKLVITPAGKVTRVTVTGKFAGQPEAECVTAAVKSATFPPWDGGSQTMGYSFLLSE